MWKSALTNIRTASKLNFAALVAVEKLMLVLGLETRECRSTELCGITKRTVEQFANYWMSQVTNGMRWLRRCCCVRCCCCGDGAAGRTRVRCSVFDCVLDWMGILYAVRCWVVGVHTARRSLHDVMSFSVLDARDGWICVVNKSLCCTVLEVRGWRCERTKWMRESERAHTRPLSAVATACGTHFSARGTWMAWLKSSELLTARERRGWFCISFLNYSNGFAVRGALLITRYTWSDGHSISECHVSFAVTSSEITE